MANRYVFPSGDGKKETVGNKASQIQFLMENGYRVPRTLFLSWKAQLEYGSNPSVIEDIREELSPLMDPDKPYAVRSSANVEDDAQISFAGQFDSFLNVEGLDGIMESINRVWESAGQERPGTYLARTNTGTRDVKMGVIIQEMVPAEASGVSFSRNPMTGLNETIIEAVEGTDTSLVQKGKTPQRWIRKWGTWVTRPGKSRIPMRVIEEVAEGTRQIEADLGAPVDLEWVFDGQQVNWIQVRQITSLDKINIYSNRISREVLPGMIKPLIWSVNTPLVNGAWVRLFTELIGENDIDPQSLSKQFYYRAYFNMGVIGRIFEALGMPKESLEILMGIEGTGDQKPKFKPTARTLLHLPRLLAFAVDKWKFSPKVESFLPQVRSRYREVWDRDLGHMTDDEILESIDQLFSLTQETAYYNIVVPLLMQLYNRILGSQLEKMGMDIDDVDVTRGLEGLRKLDPNFHLSRIHRKYLEQNPDLAEIAGKKSLDEIRQTPGAEAFAGEIDEFLERFGHFSDSGNDFSSVPWRETPDLVLDMAIRARTPDKSGKKGISELQPPLFRRPIFGMIANRAREYRLFREQVSSLYTYGYGLFREHFLELGRRLATSGVLDDADDIFYLYYREIRSLLEKGGKDRDFTGLVDKRRKEMDDAAEVSLPTVIFGDNPPPIHGANLKEIRGIGTSRGYYTGPARLIRGMGDFDKLQTGDVLVIPYSDVGWTPLFAKAGAVIAESGGILSHSSIVAREYGIPAVVSVEGAFNLEDGEKVSVDGFTGIIKLDEEVGEDN